MYHCVYIYIHMYNCVYIIILDIVTLCIHLRTVYGVDACICECVWMCMCAGVRLYIFYRYPIFLGYIYIYKKKKNICSLSRWVSLWQPWV